MTGTQTASACDGSLSNDGGPSVALESVRAAYRAWLSKHAPTDWRRYRRGGIEAEVELQRDWLRTLNQGGWAGAHWPVEFGGRGASLAEQIILYEENARADAPSLTVFGMSLMHAAVTIMMHGTPAQKAAHLPPILDGSHIWCQGFSEPEAGSDLANIRTRAIRDGDHYVVTGQKTWSSRAQVANWCLLLVRTNESASRHRGITYLLLDLASPGVEVRPIKSLLGSDEFCEIFLTDVKVPVANRLGDDDDGWSVAQTTLSAERGLYLLPVVNRLRQEVDAYAALVRNDPSAGREAAAQVLARDYGDVAVLSAMLDTSLRASADGSVNRLAPLLKLYYSEVAQRVTGDALESAGLEGHVAWDDIFDVNAQTFDGNWARTHYSSWAWTIGGGTSEVQRNLIAERLLGLPKDPRPQQQL